jgi:hypothetical protein
MPSIRQVGCGIALLFAVVALALHAADIQLLHMKKALAQVLQADLRISEQQADDLVDADPSVTPGVRGVMGYLQATPSVGQCGAKLKGVAPKTSQHAIDSILWPEGNPRKGTSCHDRNYFRTINTIAGTLFLLIPAIVLFVVRRPGGPGPHWVVVWTAAYVAFLLHLYYGVGGILGGDLALITHDSIAPPRVTHPLSDSVTAAWWTLDVALAWFVTFPPRWVRLERAVLVFVLFLSAIGSAVVLSSNSYVRILGVALVVCALGAEGYRIFRHPFDPASGESR